MNKEILVIGDSILDETVVSTVAGTSLETPTLKTTYDSSKINFGGAANVVSHLLALGCNVTFLTFLGNDSYLNQYEKLKSKNLSFIPTKLDMENTVKTRYWIKSGEACYKYLQINRGKRQAYAKTTIEGLLSPVAIQSRYDCALLVDYSLGMLDNIDGVNLILQKLNHLGCPVLASSQLSSNNNNYPLFKGVDYMCMNFNEALANLHDFDGSPSSIKQLASHLKTNVCVTLGKSGFIFFNDGKIIKKDGFKVNCIDPVGAGDAFLAAFAVHMNKNLELCNKWAALSTTKMGTETPNISELYDD